MAKSSQNSAILQAEYWLILLHSPNFTQEQEGKFLSWLESSAENQAAYLKAEETWQRGAVLSEARVPRKKSAETDKNSGWFGEMLGFGAWSQVATACFVVLSVAAGGYWHYLGGREDVQFYQTSVGEQQELMLSDGSVIVLNTNSKVKTVMSRQKREVHLEYGEVFFRVTHDGSNFDVHTDSGVIRVVGTEFRVYDSGDKTIVTVLDGAVAVDDKSDNQGDQEFDGDVTLRKNQEVVVEEASKTLKPKNVDASAVMSWRTKSVVFRGDPLSAVVKELNRYFDTKLRLGDPSLASNNVAAVIQITDFDTMLAMLTQSLGLEAKPSSEGGLQVVFLFPEANESVPPSGS